ncbi:hypothetical protein AVEN_135323-1 [Araneus ventricosus]|uniref:Uncharacterized protein n=1 Tax=Araneus ventricosus TaxID=182803 RepID=A0A4Y2KS88_ARAVE|nr:hypothetical protein AVEN_135323-1 [Araneus ventricosus]
MRKLGKNWSLKMVIHNMTPPPFSVPGFLSTLHKRFECGSYLRPPSNFTEMHASGEMHSGANLGKRERGGKAHNWECPPTLTQYNTFRCFLV